MTGEQQAAYRVRQRESLQRRRKAWREAGLCIECGKARRWPTVKCELCLIGTQIRVDRCIFKKRMARASLK